MIYTNCGDVNFFEHGLLMSNEHSDTEIEVLYCMPYPDEEDKYQFAELTVDLRDPWLLEHRDEILSFAGMENSSPDVFQFAAAAIDYFGPENFGAASIYAYDWRNMTRKEILDILRMRNIAVDGNVEYFSSGVDEA